MEQITIDNNTYYTWEKFLKVAGLKNRKSIYDWVNSGRATVYKVGSCSFYRQS